MTSIYDQDLPQTPANFAPMSPLSFIERTAEVYPTRLAVVHGGLRQDWATTYRRCRQLASALSQAGIGKNDTVAVMLPNTPPMVEAHFGIPMAGAVLNTLNTRLDPETIAFMLDHGEAKAVIIDPEFAGVMKKAIALRQSKAPLLVIDVEDVLFSGPAEKIGTTTYEAFVAQGDPAFAWSLPANEWDAIALNYTSGTTGNPKGVVYHHRGAATNAISNVLEWDMPKHAVYLWTLPMFHCNGWCFPWTLAVMGGTHVCLRRIDPARIFALIAEHGVTHLCAAPVVLTMLIHAPEDQRRAFPHRVGIATGGAAPPSPVIAAMERLGFDVTHLYGLTECYGPSLLCAWQPELANLALPEKAAFMARQGVPLPTLEDATVLDQDTGARVPADGTTLGEISLRGNTVMKGYLRNPKANAAAFVDGWFRTGDLGVLHPDGYIEVKDRAKDIVISGGENISSLEVEEALYKHPEVMEAAVVAHPDPKWGEVPHAFVTLKPGARATEADIIAHCRATLAHFKAPRHVTFGALPKTATGKIQKFELRRALRED